MASFWIFLPAALFGGFWDLRHRRVPNLLNLGILLAAFAWHSRSGSVPAAFGGAALGLAALLMPYFTGGMGAGDVKFMAALCAAAAFPRAVDVVLWSALSGGVLVFVLALGPADWKEAWLSTASGKGEGFLRAFRTVASRRSEKVPYAMAMTAGFVLSAFFPVFPWGGPS